MSIRRSISVYQNVCIYLSANQKVYICVSEGLYRLCEGLYLCIRRSISVYLSRPSSLGSLHIRSSAEQRLSEEFSSSSGTNQ